MHTSVKQDCQNALSKYMSRATRWMSCFINRQKVKWNTVQTEEDIHIWIYKLLELLEVKLEKVVEHGLDYTRLMVHACVSQ